MSRTSSSDENSVESRQVIQTTRKVLAALEALNQHQALRVAEMARLLELPRTTTVRVLETLRELKYVDRRADDRRYHLTTRVLSLSSGFSENFGLVQLARPILDALCDELRWPVSLSALSGFALRVYYTTDARTPHMLFRSVAGVDMPLRRTSSGVVHLAFCSDAARQLLLEGTRDEAAKGGRTDAVLALELPATRARGWHYQDHSYVESPEFRGFQDKEGVMSVPVLRDGSLLAILSSRVIRRAVREDWLATVLAPRLQRAAASIAAALEPTRSAP
jgi:IclR family transcriptional regulator, mhp operon transcriptional activator